MSQQSDKFVNHAPELGPRYRLIRELGRGGSSRVFLTEDAYLRKRVALKLLHEDLLKAGEFRELQREFAVLTELSHPSIARVHDFGYLGGVPFFTSDHIDGEPVTGLTGTLSDQDLLLLAYRLTEAVAFLHRYQILHLDIKPANIVRGGRSRDAPVLIDFGLYRRGLPATPQLEVKGSLPCMAPEYFRGEPLGPWTDVYALGASLFYVATGTYPRRSNGSPPGTTDADVIPPTVSSARSELALDLESILLRCLALDRHSRFATAGDLLSALKELAEGPNEVTEVTQPPARTVGRTEELAKIEEFLDGLDALDAGNRPRVLAFTGAPGMGQSQLLRELKVRAQTCGWSVYLQTGHAGAAAPPGSLLDCLEFHIPREDAKRRWRTFLSRLRQPRSAARSETHDAERRMRRSVEMNLAASALGERLLIVVDGLQYWDEISLELTVALIKWIGKSNAPIAIALGYREEGPGKTLLAEITRELFDGKNLSIITLGPLSVEATWTLGLDHRCVSERDSSPFQFFQQTGGCPASVTTRGRPAFSPDATANAARCDSLSEDSRDVLTALSVAERPLSRAELNRLTGVSSQRLRGLLEDLARKGLALRRRSGSRRSLWLAASGVAAVPGLLTPKACRRLHLAMAKGLVEASARRDGPKLVEAFRHFQAAGSRSAISRWGPGAARYLAATFQNRAALSALQAVFEVLPRSGRRRLQVAAELAHLYLRVGELKAGIRLLQSVLDDAGDQRTALTQKALLWLGTLHVRDGAFERGEALLREGLERTTGLSRGDVLYFVNEHASAKVLLGRHEEALALCSEGLAMVGRRSDVSTVELLLNLRATRANVALRRFDYEAAARDYEHSLQKAEAYGSYANRAVILNNLGIVHTHLDRYHEAVGCFEEAERTCLRIDEGPSLVTIYANLSVLHAKLGEFDLMEQTFDHAAQLEPSLIGRRHEYIFVHAHGLCLLYQGRYSKAREAFDRAVELAHELGDGYLVLFDAVFAAECLVWEASYADASSEFERLSEPQSPPRIRRMALARKAYLAALIGREADVSREWNAWLAVPEAHPVPFLESSDTTFLGWALAIVGLPEGLHLLEKAERFFSKVGATPYASLARLARAEGLFFQGKSKEAGSLLERRAAGSNHLAEAGSLLLSARLRRSQGDDATSRLPCADLLARAGSLMIANRLPEWSLRLRMLRATLRPGGDSSFEEERRKLSLQLPCEMRSAYVEQPLWCLWKIVHEEHEQLEGGDSTARVSTTVPGPREAETRGQAVDTETQRLPARAGSSLRARLAVKSAAMRRVVDTLDQLRSSDVTVVIHGESGTGKDLIARLIHQESSRVEAPFLVLDCASIPEGLFESELFGAHAGAFTDQTVDREGVLREVDGGTLVLERVASVPLESQAKLLGVLAGQGVRPLGGDAEQRLNIRFLVSTSVDLAEEVRKGRLREDLFHRLNVVTLSLPPLRQRTEDFPQLLEECLAECDRPEVGRDVLERLQRLRWPGNVRELQNFVKRLAIESSGLITLSAVEQALAERHTTSMFAANVLSGTDLKSLQSRLEREYILHHFHRLKGDAKALCQLLQLSQRQLQRRCLRLGIRLAQERRRRS